MSAAEPAGPVINPLSNGQRVSNRINEYKKRDFFVWHPVQMQDFVHVHCVKVHQDPKFSYVKAEDVVGTYKVSDRLYVAPVTQDDRLPATLLHADGKRTELYVVAIESFGKFFTGQEGRVRNPKKDIEQRLDELLTHCDVYWLSDVGNRVAIQLADRADIRLRWA